MTEILKVINLYKSFGKTQVLNGVSFAVNRGEAVLLLGPNGAGKTTIIKCILGLLNYRGNIMVDGIDAKSKGSLARAKIGYLPQLSSYYETLTVSQHATLMASLKGATKDEVKSALEMAGLSSLKDRLVKALSSGMRQRLGLSIAMLGNPPLLILDEPTSNIDLEGQLEFKKLLEELKESGKAFLISTHLSGLDVLSDRVMILNSGRIVAQGSSDEILNLVGAKDRMYIKIPHSQEEKVRIIANSFGQQAEFKDGWIYLTLRTDDKARFLTSMVQSGIKIEDIIVEQFSIESEYIRIIRSNSYDK
jgi:ABC-type multidrug transport system ATPase subunit